ncbi:hypothetical protein [Methylotuvimicrobium sp. KM1]|uniref:hypothetical protein n=1 Tax=Methylotuvimicrobium sp. KM1 TaxID=3377707 RepID=UPI00384FA6A3
MKGQALQSLIRAGKDCSNTAKLSQNATDTAALVNYSNIYVIKIAPKIMLQENIFPVKLRISDTMRFARSQTSCLGMRYEILQLLATGKQQQM